MPRGAVAFAPQPHCSTNLQTPACATQALAGGAQQSLVAVQVGPSGLRCGREAPAAVADAAASHPPRREAYLERRKARIDKEMHVKEKGGDVHFSAQ